MRVAPLALSGLLLAAGVAGAATIVGTAGDDRLVGTARADVIRGLAGGDRLVGGGGADLLEGGPGADAVIAGPGDDRVSVAYDGARDSVRCGPGTDVVNADLLDTVSGDCELVGRRLSRDPYGNPESRHETEVEPSSLTVGRTTVSAFQVGRRLQGGATNIGFAVTDDRARSWTSGLLPGLTTASRPPGASALASDPVVAYDAAHRVWLVSSLAFAAGATTLPVNRSSDGSTWSPAVVAAEETTARGVAFDKNWLTCDNTRASPFFGRCYLAYTHTSDGEALAVRTSTDGGATWSEPAEVGSRPAVGVIPVVRPGGELVLVYLWQTKQPAIAASRSSDGGSTFSPPARIARIAGRCRVPRFRAFPLPSADVTATGEIWATWHDCASPSASTNAVFVASSADGAAWTSPSVVTTGRNAVLPAIGVDPESGAAAVAYHRVGPAGVDVELVESRGDSTRWSSPHRLSAQSMHLDWMPPTTSGRMLGDYISVDYAGGRPLVVWVLASPPVRGSLRQAVYATRG